MFPQGPPDEPGGLTAGLIVWYWATVLASGAVALGSSRIVRWVDRASAWATGILSRNTLPVAVGVVVILLIGYVLDQRRRRGERVQPGEPHSTHSE